MAPISWVNNVKISEESVSILVTEDFKCGTNTHGSICSQCKIMLDEKSYNSSNGGPWSGHQLREFEVGSHSSGALVQAPLAWVSFHLNGGTNTQQLKLDQLWRR
ncbi:hypothetical protein VNO78_02615 [Psophocarpus tetragonolobus]|uniref:Uncharacterized protein n=1 Tax=Psophocarpus tetragonolobus TaxID=3891 RepID=A0AAN9XVA1_PSOTE